MRRLLLTLVLIPTWALTTGARAESPADSLLRLVPVDAGLTVAVEDLRDHARQIGGSPLLEGLQRLPAARDWLASERARTLQKSARDVETALGLPLAAIRDEIAGDAVVLTLQPGPPDRPEQARGLLLALPRDPGRIEPLMARLNDVQIRGGELDRVEQKFIGTVRYAVRKFHPGGRSDEYHVQMEGGVFAWSNSEEMILGVIDRKRSGGKGLGDVPAFRKVRQGLPGRSIVSLFVDPRLVERAMVRSTRPARTSGERASAMLSRYVGAVDYAGASLRFRDGVFLHTHEAIDAGKLDPWLRRWLTGPSDSAPLSRLVPETALAVVSAHVDYEAIRQALEELVAEEDRGGLENLGLAVRGLLMGLDPVAEVVPRLGPATLFYVAAGPRFPLVAAVGWKPGPGGDDLAGPLGNALRTALALYALDPSRRAAHLRVETQALGEAGVTTLTDGRRPLLGYRVDRGRVVLGNDPGEVARFGSGPPPSLASSLRSEDFPESETFGVVDLGRLVREVRADRGPIARRLASRSRRPVEAVDGDLGQLLGLADLFRAATFSTVTGPDAGEIHRSVGLLGR